jgi:hypothetical protein
MGVTFLKPMRIAKKRENRQNYNDENIGFK